MCLPLLQTLVTLRGLIYQVFDKALTDTHFCDMYSDLCLFISDKANALVFEDSEDPSGKKINFRRLLLGKCQTEFEAGTAAMKAVEQQEANEKKQAAESKTGDTEEGESGPPPAPCFWGQRSVLCTFNHTPIEVWLKPWRGNSEVFACAPAKYERPANTHRRRFVVSFQSGSRTRPSVPNSAFQL